MTNVGGDRNINIGFRESGCQHIAAFSVNVVRFSNGKRPATLVVVDHARLHNCTGSVDYCADDAIGTEGIPDPPIWID